MDEQEFKDGDLMPWQDMTRNIKNLQVFTDEHTERLQTFEKEIGRISFLGYDANEQFKLITNCLEKIKWLEARVDSLTRSLDILQEVTGIEVVVTPESGNSNVSKLELKPEEGFFIQQDATHEGQCELCDRVAPLNGGNICEACFWEELDNDKYLVL